jgi:hypothetical protein
LFGSHPFRILPDASPDVRRFGDVGETAGASALGPRASAPRGRRQPIRDPYTLRPRHLEAYAAHPRRVSSRASCRWYSTALYCPSSAAYQLSELKTCAWAGITNIVIPDPRGDRRRAEASAVWSTHSGRSGSAADEHEARAHTPASRRAARIARAFEASSTANARERASAWMRDLSRCRSHAARSATTGRPHSKQSPSERRSARSARPRARRRSRHSPHFRDLPEHVGHGAARVWVPSEPLIVSTIKRASFAPLRPSRATSRAIARCSPHDDLPGDAGLEHLRQIPASSFAARRSRSRSRHDVHGCGPGRQDRQRIQHGLQLEPAL